MNLAHKADVFLSELDVYGACKLHKSFRSEDAGGLDQLEMAAFQILCDFFIYFNQHGIEASSAEAKSLLVEYRGLVQGLDAATPYSFSVGQNSRLFPELSYDESIKKIDESWAAASSGIVHYHKEFLSNLVIEYLACSVKSNVLDLVLLRMLFESEKQAYLRHLVDKKINAEASDILTKGFLSRLFSKKSSKVQQSGTDAEVHLGFIGLDQTFACAGPVAISEVRRRTDEAKKFHIVLPQSFEVLLQDVEKRETWLPSVIGVDGYIDSYGIDQRLNAAFGSDRDEFLEGVLYEAHDLRMERLGFDPCKE